MKISVSSLLPFLSILAVLLVSLSSSNVHALCYAKVQWNLTDMNPYDYLETMVYDADDHLCAIGTDENQASGDELTQDTLKCTSKYKW